MYSKIKTKLKDCWLICMQILGCAVGAAVLETVAPMSRPLWENNPIGAIPRGKPVPMGATLKFANPLAGAQFVDKNKKESDENGAKDKNSYLFRTAARFTS